MGAGRPVSGDGPGVAVAGVVLAAGAGTRLRPLTRLRPKPLCPVGARALVDHALDRLSTATSAQAVNAHYGLDQMEAHLAGRVHLSIEPDGALGTAGALGHLREWIDRRPTVVVNGDTWTPVGLESLLAGWDRVRVRVLVAGRPELRPGVVLLGTALPWHAVADLEPVPSGLYARCIAPAAAAGRLEIIGVDAPAFDCGTPRGYLEANLQANGGESVVGVGAEVAGRVRESVVWPGSRVAAGERLWRAIRAERLTVLVR